MATAASERIQSRDQGRRAEAIFQRFAINANVRSRGRLDLELRCLVRLGRELHRAGRCPTSLIEANAPACIVANQTHAPLLADPRAARVFRRHGLGGGRPG